MSSTEFTEWMAFAQMEPFGWDADQYGHAMTTCMIANVNRGKDDEPYNVSDFMPHEPDPPQEPDDMKKIAEMMTVAGFGTLEREG